ncbi:MAG: hypothetical protein VB957_06510 [Pseudomonadales bacterium]|jgi:hypothetical protein
MSISLLHSAADSLMSGEVTRDCSGKGNEEASGYHSLAFEIESHELVDDELCV